MSSQLWRDENVKRCIEEKAFDFCAGWYVASAWIDSIITFSWCLSNREWLVTAINFQFNFLSAKGCLQSESMHVYERHKYHNHHTHTQQQCVF